MLGCIWWCGDVFINNIFYAHYHPMQALGDRFSSLRTWAISVPIVLAPTMAILWFWRRPLAPAFYLLGTIALTAAVAMTFLPRVDSGYEQVYWVGNQRHSIPWIFRPHVFDPYIGAPQRPGDYFLVRAWGEDLVPYYERSGQRPRHFFVLGKSNAFNRGQGGPAPEDNCLVGEYHFRCEWQNGDYVYAMSISASEAPSTPQSLFKPVEELLNSFEVGEE